jgi:hypothetical protein
MSLLLGDGRGPDLIWASATSLAEGLRHASNMLTFGITTAKENYIDVIGVIRSTQTLDAIFVKLAVKN